jgi:hypothetical protein
MKKEMYEISMKREGEIIIIAGPDHGEGEQKVIITVDQVPILIEWLKYAAEEPEAE